MTISSISIKYLKILQTIYIRTSAIYHAICSKMHRNNDYYCYLNAFNVL